VEVGGACGAHVLEQMIDGSRRAHLDSSSMISAT
jgi:hypothetical protein